MTSARTAQGPANLAIHTQSRSRIPPGLCNKGCVDAAHFKQQSAKTSNTLLA